MKKTELPLRSVVGSVDPRDGMRGTGINPNPPAKPAPQPPPPPPPPRKK